MTEHWSCEGLYRHLCKLQGLVPTAVSVCGNIEYCRSRRVRVETAWGPVGTFKLWVKTQGYLIISSQSNTTPSACIRRVSHHFQLSKLESDEFGSLDISPPLSSPMTTTADRPKFPCTRAWLLASQTACSGSPAPVHLFPGLLPRRLVPMLIPTLDNPPRKLKERRSHASCRVSSDRKTRLSDEPDPAKLSNK
ncbi:hypothetical protein M378DRAFT_650122 [Amanita muscaria Koide BX008]|uniref:Uncharacterized protein n=1 Tax=Amanita muscaria (strain Koide BX008) TaxID=946122 RepID=A0A0C2WQ72_AMAMK|nr:hypothetical protein M378DRAFT_650122 [Amanita muscaria Koide BX008]